MSKTTQSFLRDRPMPQSVFPYTSAPHKELPQNDSLRQDILHVLNHGYVILRNQFSSQTAAQAKAEIARLSGGDPERGRNPFEGLNTNRIYSLLNKSREFDQYVTFKRVLELNDYFLEPGYCLSAMHTIQINPGEVAQDFHHDDAFAPIPRPRPPLGSAIIVAFDDFTATNGATRIVPGSHLWPSGVRPTDDQAQPAVCPAGSVVYFISTTWHSGGRNESTRPRMSMTVQYCQPYMRQIENQYLAVDPRKLDEIPPRIVELMGYKTFAGFIGYADGLNPREAARRMVAWQQKPVNRQPPTFAHHRDSKM
ncbi:uncharacterized protein PV09_07399 [Verruconis gallopava]|uniref:Phytanoyl-CoA dioxygenase n=1 Tax=Verruconis gallopava TaxID=253628 RepID=A0A0D1XFZ3_9PEZI|nr:uncharacterized protein PV09_07399 [Verruconis gallopava]KIW01111.1 hypothetical protein PV09_07399 [Verruconis gallopava]